VGELLKLVGVTLIALVTMSTLRILWAYLTDGENIIRERRLEEDRRRALEKTNDHRHQGTDHEQR